MPATPPDATAPAISVSTESMASVNDPNTGASSGSATPAPNPAPTDGLRFLPLFLYCFPVDVLIGPFDYIYVEHTRTDSFHDDPGDLTGWTPSPG
jgi:hypothetical protein